MTQSVAAILVSSCLAFFVDDDRSHLPLLLHIRHGHDEIHHGLQNHVNHPIDHPCHHCGGGRSNHHHNLFLPDNFDDLDLHHRKIVYPLRMAYHYPLFLHLSMFDNEDNIRLVDNYLIHTNIYDVLGNQYAPQQ